MLFCCNQYPCCPTCIVHACTCKCIITNRLTLHACILVQYCCWPALECIPISGSIVFMPLLSNFTLPLLFVQTVGMSASAIDATSLSHPVVVRGEKAVEAALLEGAFLVVDRDIDVFAIASEKGMFKP